MAASKLFFSYFQSPFFQISTLFESLFHAKITYLEAPHPPTPTRHSPTPPMTVLTLEAV
jgi:hypothetical protein